MLPDFLYCLGELAKMPPKLACRAFRSLPLNVRALEAAVVARCVEDLFRSDRILNRFNGAVRKGACATSAKLCRKWQEVERRHRA